MALFKKFDEGRNNLEGEITEAAVTKFVAGNALPLVVDFNQETAQKIFSGKLVALPPPLPPSFLYCLLHCFQNLAFQALWWELIAGSEVIYRIRSQPLSFDRKLGVLISLNILKK